MKPMIIQNKKSRAAVYKLIGLCLAADFLGCVLPLVSVLDHHSTSEAYLIAMESVGAVVLLLVFAEYLLKR
jgi:uncharacterized membrane protein YjfL (UPF0719 family)